MAETSPTAPLSAAEIAELSELVAFGAPDAAEAAMWRRLLARLDALERVAEAASKSAWIEGALGLEEFGTHNPGDLEMLAALRATGHLEEP